MPDHICVPSGACATVPARRASRRPRRTPGPPCPSSVLPCNLLHSTMDAGEASGRKKRPARGSRTPARRAALSDSDEELSSEEGSELEYEPDPAPETTKSVCCECAAVRQRLPQLLGQRECRGAGLGATGAHPDRTPPLPHRRARTQAKPRSDEGSGDEEEAAAFTQADLIEGEEDAARCAGRLPGGLHWGTGACVHRLSAPLPGADCSVMACASRVSAVEPAVLAGDVRVRHGHLPWTMRPWAVLDRLSGQSSTPLCSSPGWPR